MRADQFRLTVHALGGTARDIEIRSPREGENPAHVAVSAYEYTMRNAGEGTQVTLYRNGRPERQITIRGKR